MNWVRYIASEHDKFLNRLRLEIWKRINEESINFLGGQRAMQIRLYQIVAIMEMISSKKITFPEFPPLYASMSPFSYSAYCSFHCCARMPGAMGKWVSRVAMGCRSRISKWFKRNRTRRTFFIGFGSFFNSPIEPMKSSAARQQLIIWLFK